VAEVFGVMDQIADFKANVKDPLVSGRNFQWNGRIAAGETRVFMYRSRRAAHRNGTLFRMAERLRQRQSLSATRAMRRDGGRRNAIFEKTTTLRKGPLGEQYYQRDGGKQWTAYCARSAFPNMDWLR
jgi:hypothetical protein